MFFNKNKKSKKNNLKNRSINQEKTTEVTNGLLYVGRTIQASVVFITLSQLPTGSCKSKS
jgi:hypothetical protein